MSNLIQNVFEWNKDRGLIDKEFDLDLEYAMLKEELIELIIADNKVDVADAIGDIIFVALGSLSKLARTEQNVSDIMLSICAANDQKKAEVRPDGEQAGKIVKPLDFVGPEEAISRILQC